MKEEIERFKSGFSKRELITIFSLCLLMIILTFVTPYYGDIDTGDYSDVSKYFAGKFHGDIRASHSFLYGYIHYPLVSVFDSFFIFKITSLIFIFLIIASLYYHTKDKRVLWLALLNPAFWYMAPWINPIQIASLLVLWAYISIRKYNNSERLKYLIFSGILVGLGIGFWNTVLYISVFFILAFLLNRKFYAVITFVASLFLGLLPLFILDYHLFNFPFYSLIKTTAGNLSATFFGGIYGSAENSFNWSVLVLSLMIIPIYFWRNLKINRLKDHSNEILFILLCILLIFSNIQIRYLIIIIPIILLFLSDKINKVEFARQIGLSCIITSLVIASFLLQIFYAGSSSCDVKCLLEGNARLDHQEFGSILIKDISEISEVYPNKAFVVGNSPDSFQYLASIYWGGGIKKFVSIQDYRAWSENETVLFERRWSPEINIKDRRILWISGGMSINPVVLEDLDKIEYALTINETINLPNFELVEKYRLINVYKKKD